MISNCHREAIIGFLGLWLMCSTGAFAQHTGIAIHAPSPKQFEVQPGRTLSLGVVVINHGPAAAVLEDLLELPQGCQRIAPHDEPFSLEAGQQTVRIVVARVSSATPAGHFEIGYVARARGAPDTQASARIPFSVTAVNKLDLTVAPRPERVLAGDTYSVKLWATNRGNSPLTAELTHRSSLGFDIATDASTFELMAGQSREIMCQVITPRDFDRHARHAVTFDLRASSESGTALSASQASVAEIIPLVSSPLDAFHRLSTKLRQVAIVETGQDPQFQAEISGFGSLDEAGERRVEFLFRGPGVEGATFFGAREQYGASYSDRRWDLAIGDRVYELSPLTEKRSFGRGASVAWNGNNVSAGAFYMATRYRSLNADQWGGFLRKALSENSRVQANFLRKSAGGSRSIQTSPQSIVSIETSHRIGERHNLRLEAAVGSSVAKAGGHSAYYLDARGMLPGELSYSLEHARAGPNFHGYYSDTETTFASLAKPFGEKWRAHASLNRHAANLALNDIRSSIVNREDSWKAGVTFAQSDATEFQIERQRTDRADILEPFSYDFTEETTRFGVSHRLGAVSTRSYIDFGDHDNAITGESGPFQRYGASVNWRPTSRQNYSISGSYGPSAYTGSTNTNISASISGRWQLTERLRAHLSYTRNKFDGLTGKELDQALASLEYEFRNKSSLSLVSRWSSITTNTKMPTQDGGAALLVTYTVPLKIPVGRKQSIGTLRGRLIDETKRSDAGLERVVVQVGDQYAVTDETGHFEFPSLKPGIYHLQVLQDSLGPHLAVSSELPLKVEVQPAKTSEVQLSAAPAGSITVRVKRFAFADGDSITTSGALREERGEEAVTVEISNGHELWRAQTDRKGHVSFDRLASGRWVLRIASNDLPPLHAIEEPARAISLKPGESEHVSVRVLPKRRTLRLLDEGRIREELADATRSQIKEEAR